MKLKITSISFLIVGIVLGAIISSLTIQHYAPAMIIKELKSPFGTEKTIAKINEETTRLSGWEVLSIEHRSEKLKIANEYIDTYTIIRLCNKKSCKDMLADDERKKVAVLLPIQIAVYEKNNGQTYISIINHSILNGVLGKQYALPQEFERILHFAHYKSSVL